MRIFGLNSTAVLFLFLFFLPRSHFTLPMMCNKQALICFAGAGAETYQPLSLQSFCHIWHRGVAPGGLDGRIKSRLITWLSSSPRRITYIFCISRDYLEWVSVFCISILSSNKRMEAKKSYYFPTRICIFTHVWNRIFWFWPDSKRRRGTLNPFWNDAPRAAGRFLSPGLLVAAGGTQPFPFFFFFPAPSVEKWFCSGVQNNSTSICSQ